MAERWQPQIAIAPLDHRAEASARERQRQLLKPEGSLGRLEELAAWMAAVSGEELPSPRPRIVVAAADHGVAAERVSAYPQEVTGQMLAAFLGGGSAISVLAAEAGAEVVVVDAGVVAPPTIEDGGRVVLTGLRPSRSIVAAPALDEEQVRTAIECGRRVAHDAAQGGANLLVGGDMGIANTTPATCLASWLTGIEVGELCGRGTGVDDEGLARKRDACRRALALHGSEIDGPLEALRRLGGGEITVLCGLALGAGEQGIGFVCDGLIATAAIAVAVALAPELRPRLVAGHRSPEPAHAALLDHLELEPLLELGMRLGEASGAAAALAVLRLACALHARMATFEQARVSGRAP